MDRKVILRRRAVAVLAAAAATACIYLLIAGGSSSTGTGVEGPRLADLSTEAGGRLAELSQEEKIEQLLMVGLEPGSDPAEQRPAGAYLLTSETWPGAGAARGVTRAVRKGAGSRPAPLIVARQEGGSYRTLFDLPPDERQIAIGDAGEAKGAKKWSEKTARALARAGIHMNLGPVADVAALDSPIADRAFSDTTAVVRRMTIATLRGCKQAGIACAPGRFPGLGGANQDTDQGQASVSLDADTLASRDIAPFVAAFAAGAPAVVISHAFYAAHDPVVPASLSPVVLSDLLRTRLEYGGVAITDDLNAGAIRSGYTVPEAAVRAVVAGADMVQFSDPDAYRGTVAALQQAVNSGEISRARLDEAVGRVLELKRELDLL